jgi:glycosyltransferase involved in cell wall biosynthesis
MMTMAEIGFWSSLIFISYTYFGYPLTLFVISLFRNRPVRKNGEITPKVTFIITAYNEEKRIKDKIENTLKLVYPESKLEIIVASDGSTDRTEEIIDSYKLKGVRLVKAPERKGKEGTQKYAVEAALGEILIFSDVATILKPDGVSRIVGNFSCPQVGCVSSVDRVIDKDGNISGEGAYVRYEMFLRNLETRANTLIGMSGSLFAARKEVCRDWAVDLQSDFNTLLNSVKAGLRGVSDPESIGYYSDIMDEKREYDRKVRTVLRGIAVFMNNLSMLNPMRYGLFSWQLLSHKLFRWLVPFALILAFVSNGLLVSDSKVYLILFILQAFFYGMALMGICLETFSRKGLWKIPAFFVLVNLSILRAWYRYCKGERVLKWAPSQR